MCSLRNIVVLSNLGIPRFDHLSLVSCTTLLVAEGELISTKVGRTGVLCSLRVPVRVRALLSYWLSILWKAFSRSVICVLPSFPLYSILLVFLMLWLYTLLIIFALFCSNDPNFYSIWLSTYPRFLSIFPYSLIVIYVTEYRKFGVLKVQVFRMFLDALGRAQMMRSTWLKQGC